jgi:hypothetical protein
MPSLGVSSLDLGRLWQRRRPLYFEDGNAGLPECRWGCDFASAEHTGIRPRDRLFFPAYKNSDVEKTPAQELLGVDDRPAAVTPRFSLPIEFAK